MDKPAMSRRLNKATGGTDELLCYRIYIQSRIYGGFWIVLEASINTLFLLIRKERRHVTRNYHWQRREYEKAKVQADQITNKEAPEPASHHQTGADVLENILERSVP